MIQVVNFEAKDHRFDNNFIGFLVLLTYF